MGKKKVTTFSDSPASLVNETRASKIMSLVARRQNLSVILENVHDPHNIGAVLRSCDAVGVPEVFILYTEESNNYHRQYIGKNTSSGAKKWVKVWYFNDMDKCFEAARQRYDRIFGTYLGEDSVSLYNLDLTVPVALMFGNEHDGLSAEAVKHLDGNYIIPQYGMVQSLNISVACAVSLFEASRQRQQKGMYDLEYDQNNPGHAQMMEQLVNSHLVTPRKKGY